jgi:hypothetical protein
MGKIKWYGFVFFLCFLMLLNSIHDGSIQTVLKSTVKQSDIREITILYHVHLDTAYTGTVSYFPYDGVKNFTISEKTFSTYGLSGIYEAMFEFRRVSGETCKLFVDLQSNHGKNALIRCRDRVFLMNVCILKKDDGNFAIFIAPDEEEVDSMTKTYNITI